MSPSKNGIYPATNPQFSIWFTSVVVGFVGGLSAIISLYFSSYLFISQKIKSILSDNRIDTLGILMQRAALKNSIFMTLGVLLCQVPQGVILAITANMKSGGQVVANVGLVFGVVSVVVTPCWVAYFSFPLKREVVFWRRGRIDEED
ncbi:hypothetical protein HDU98_000007 [Podochytrium sp. JEL0797]|nr:hypothetical protein HDU98_000007 [Podochytrium sp. JEL0797]